MPRVEFLPAAARDFRRLPPELAPRVALALDRLAAEPDAGKPLQGPYAGLRSHRVGDWRIVYRHGAGVVLVLRIGHRRDVYR